MRDTHLYEQILGLAAPWSVSEVEMNQEAKLIAVRIELPPAARLACPVCGRADCGIKDRQERVWRHLDTCDYQTLITCPLPRIDCPDCGITSDRSQWQPIFRWVREAGKAGRLVAVLRHRHCNGLAFVMLD